MKYNIKLFLKTKVKLENCHLRVKSIELLHSDHYTLSAALSLSQKGYFCKIAASPCRFYLRQGWKHYKCPLVHKKVSSPSRKFSSLLNIHCQIEISKPTAAL